MTTIFHTVNTQYSQHFALLSFTSKSKYFILKWTYILNLVKIKRSNETYLGQNVLILD